MFRPNALLNAAKKAATLRTVMPMTSATTSRLTVPLSYRFYSSGGHADIEARVMDILHGFDKIDAQKLNVDAHFVNDLGLDSLDTVEVIMAIEEDFSIEIPDNEADEIKSVRQAIDYISKRGDAH
ncbi:acyl carrier protein-like protein [Mycotypha africana]|uniref:acyl carrier protein-like protein n=1 Tax=Mycotypha africana TaxID=64632 RepID=UPI0023004ADF|nr:acyl carrier protein-like protein [Mycotypha africana]KAI8979729.1 acyl carrier protein-like protein [Mycotypha africana]